MVLQPRAKNEMLRKGLRYKENPYERGGSLGQPYRQQPDRGFNPPRRQIPEDQWRRQPVPPGTNPPRKPFPPGKFPPKKPFPPGQVACRKVCPPGQKLVPPCNCVPDGKIGPPGKFPRPPMPPEKLYPIPGPRPPTPRPPRPNPGDDAAVQKCIMACKIKGKTPKLPGYPKPPERQYYLK